MRIPKIEKYDNKDLFKNIKIDNVPTVEKDYVIMNDKDKFRLIKSIESIVRRSNEYKDYIKFLKNEIDMSKCSFFTNVSNKNSNRVSIEIHHEPFTLFDITDVVVEKFITHDEQLNPLVIADEVMKLHYQNKVGLIPLSATVHELIHDGKLFIPLQNVYGNYLEFLEEYIDYIPQYINEMLEVKLKMSKDVEVDTSILNKKYVYLEVDGFLLPQELEL